MRQLFRQEALDEQSAQNLGQIRVATNSYHFAIAVFALIFAIMSLAFSIWGEVARKIRIAGILTPELGVLHIRAVSAGEISEARVREGDFVKTGEILFILNTDRAAERGATAALISQTLLQRRQTFKAEQDLRKLQVKQRQQALDSRLRAVEIEHQQAEAESKFAQRRIDLAVKSLDRYQELAHRGFVSDTQLQAKQEDLIELESRASMAKRSATTLLREKDALKAEMVAASIQLQTDLTQIDRSIASLEQDDTENNARRTNVILAPQDGVIAAVHVTRGASVQLGQTVLTFVPQVEKEEPNKLQAELYAPSRTAGFIKSGQEIWIRYSAFPYQKFGLAKGIVVSISHTPINAQDLPVGQANALQRATQSDEPLYRIKAELPSQYIVYNGNRSILKPGMAIEADIVQERRAIWEWAFEPLLAMRQSLSI